MGIGSCEAGRGRPTKEVSLRWTERRAGSRRWWETAPAGALGRRAVVIWLRDLGRVAWWIADGGRTLALGFVDSLHEPSEAIVAEAKRAAARRWLEVAS